MSEKPIVFSTLKVRAVLEGKKTMTRRVIKPQDGISTVNEEGYVGMRKNGAGVRGMDIFYPCKYQVGDILWVRETWSDFYATDEETYIYKATEDGVSDTFRWNPSIHMPRAAARIFLEVTDVRAELLRDISEEDAMNEGVDIHFPERTAKGAFCKLWNALYAERGYQWDANPWVWVISFERTEI
jgi:hypothetical protein